jgi:hypothetical protein
MKLEINRKEWRRGPQDVAVAVSDPTALLCKDGTKCCLGFYALQCGLEENRIKGQGEPGELSFDLNEKNLPENMEKLVKFVDNDEYGMSQGNTQLSLDAMDINDKRFTTEAEREQKLINLFAKYGVEVVFYG